MKWYLAALSKYAVFRGRARRKEYWMFNLVNSVAMMILLYMENDLDLFNSEFAGVISIIYSFVVLLPSLAVTVRRLHDTNKSGWWFLISLVPMGGIVIFVFLVMDGQFEDNKYGSNPKIYRQGVWVYDTKIPVSKEE